MKRNPFSTSSAAVTIVCFLMGCASNSTLHTARPLGEGVSQGVFAVSKIMTLGEDTIPIIEQVPDFTFLEIAGALGFTERFDLGLKYTFPTAGFAEMKYCLWSTDSARGFFFSPGLRLGYTAFPHSEDDTTGNNRIEIMLPLLLSWYPANNIAFTIVPAGQARFFLDAAEESIGFLAGANANARFGDSFGFIVEAGYFYNIRWEWNEVQAGAGLFFPLPDFF